MILGENGCPTPLPAFPWAATDTATAAAGGTASITLTNAQGTDTAGNTKHQAVVITGLAFSFSAAVTAGRLTITDNGVTVFDLDLGTAAGFWVIPFPQMRKSLLDHAVVISLATGGGSGVPKLNLLGAQQISA